MERFPTGCYGDGAFGHDHTREICAGVIEAAIERWVCAGGVATSDEAAWVQATVDALKGEMSDDADEECDAVSILERYADPGPEAYWGWQDGDFGLWPVSPELPHEIPDGYAED